MINWDNFYVFAAVSICLWLAGAVFALRSSSKSKVAIGFTSGGIIILGVFIAGLWIFLQRPPLRTMGETRLWYSFFMGIAGLLTYIRWKYRWILSFSTLLSTVFVIINLMKPEIHDQSLMPALQSVWFIPHVTVYMFSYSVLGGLGKLLELGPQRNLGSHHLDGIFALHPPPPVQKNRTENTLCPAHSLLPCFTNVLVWSQLPAGGPTKRTFI